MKLETKTLSKLEIIDLNNGINRIAEVNRESLVPVYDLGYEVNEALGRTLKMLRAPIQQIIEEQKPFDEEEKELSEQLKSLEGQGKEDKRKELKPKFDDLLKRRKAWLEETMEVKLYTFKKDGMKYRGICPPPDVIMFIDPCVIWPDEK